MIPLPYGSSADWLQNVRASGSAVIVHEGNTHRVDRPEIVPRAVAFPHVPFRYQWSLRVYGVDDPPGSVGGAAGSRGADHRARVIGRTQCSAGLPSSTPAAAGILRTARPGESIGRSPTPSAPGDSIRS
jgi:hypothetical protein